MAIFALHDDFSDHSGKLLLLWGNQSRHRERTHRRLHKWSHNKLENLALLQYKVMGFFLCLIDNLRCETEPHEKTSAFTVSLNKDSDRPILDIEGNWALLLDIGFIARPSFHDVAPVEHSDVLDGLSAVHPESDCI